MSVSIMIILRLCNAVVFFICISSFIFASEVREEETAFGFKIFLSEHNAVPITSVSYAFKHGGYGHVKPALPFLVSEMLRKGSVALYGSELDKFFHDNGITINYRFDADFFYVDLISPSENLEKAFSVLSTILIKPMLKESDLILAKSKLLRGIDETKCNQAIVALHEAGKRYFCSHSYATNAYQSDKEELKNISVEDIFEYLSTTMTRQNIIVAAAGVVSSLLNDGLFDRYMIDLYDNIVLTNDAATDNNGDKRFARNDFCISIDEDINLPIYLTADKDSSQSVVGFLHDWSRSINPKEDDYYASIVLGRFFGSIGGANQSSVLFEQTRGKGLTYSPFATIKQYLYADPIMIGMVLTSKKNVPDVLSSLRFAFEKMTSDGASEFYENKLSSVKRALSNDFNLNFRSSTSASQFILKLQALGFTADDINNYVDGIDSVSAEDITSIAEKIFNRDRNDNAIFVVVDADSSASTTHEN